ncbi:MAG: hypothetical protein CL610_07435 [Anaerolineaceae bacterium]|nr:hypothetical protein [Anaerolineaceae bacterium]
MTIHLTVRPGFYADSVFLMTIARELRQLDGVTDAALVMGTEANKALLPPSGSLDQAVLAAQASDLIIMIDAGEDMLATALETMDRLLVARPTAKHDALSPPPRSLRSAVRTHPDANLALISVPGQYAAAEAWQALHMGRHVFLFSDNVSVQDERALKAYALENGLFVMGPGAGTAIINGVGVGFANAVPRGHIGIVSASGTGLQEVSTLLAKQGSGISQAIGVGGRDLSDEVGGIMTRQAIDWLQADPETAVIIAISKLPSPSVTSQIMAQLAANNKPAVVIFMSPTLPDAIGDVRVASTLHEAAMLAHVLATGGDVAQAQHHHQQKIAAVAERAAQIRSQLSPQRIYLRGLFSGGTLCEEAMRIWSQSVGPVWSNGPLEPAYQLQDSHRSCAHSAVDLGDEEFTIGRPHPMIDNELRMQRLRTEMADPTVAAIQMDIVIGYGAHPDPAAELAPVIALAAQQMPVVLSITGTDADIQQFDHQKAQFEAAGALVLESNALASHFMACLTGGARDNIRQ